MMRAGKHTSHLIFVRTVEYNSEKGMIPFKRRYIFTLKYPTNYTFIQIIYAVF
jgi:inorganic pyrophosphatase